MRARNQTGIHDVLREKFRGEDDLIGVLLGILSGTATADFVGIGTVEFELTDRERAEYVSAIIKSQRDFFGRPIAHFMSPELESLVCGHRPERYRVLEPA